MVFRPNELKFTDLMAATPHGTLVVNSQGQIVFSNHQVHNLFGFTEAELHEQNVDILVPNAARGFHHNNRNTYNAAPHPRSFPASAGLHGQHKDGSLIPVEISLTPFETTAGKFTLVNIIDITARKKAEDMREVLIKELNHRVKNNMAVVTSIATMTRKYTDNIDDFFLAYSGRMNALSAAHDLVASMFWDDTDAKSLIVNVLRPFHQAERFHISGGYARVPASSAATLAIVFHELATNALKYGSLRSAEGRVDISWEFNNNNGVEFNWIETGGNPIERPTKRGFGTTMIERTITKNFGGTIDMDYRPEGLHCKIVTERL